MVKPGLGKLSGIPKVPSPKQTPGAKPSKSASTSTEPLRLEAERRWAESDQKASRKAEGRALRNTKSVRLRKDLAEANEKIARLERSLSRPAK